MSEQTQEAPVSTDSAISNLRSALTSIANNDLSIQPPKESKPIEPTPTSPGTEAKQETQNNPNGGVEENKAESSAKDIQSEVEPTEDKAKIRWKELKQAESDLKNAQRELAELKARGGEYEQTAKEVAELKEQLEAIQQEREAIDGELYMTRVQSTREWKQYVTEPLNQIIQDAEFFSQRNKADTGELIDALQADSNGDPAKLESLIADWSERDKTKVWALADNLLQIEKRKADLESNSKAAYEQSMERYTKEQQEQYKQYMAQRENAVGEVLPKISEKVFNLLPEDKRPDINKLQQEVMGYDEWPENLKVYGILGATVLPDLVDQISSLQKELSEAKENNVKLRGGAPAAAGGNSPKSPTDAAKQVDYTKVDTDDFVKSLVSRISA
jgi:chromosome segregation ATPase